MIVNIPFADSEQLYLSVSYTDAAVRQIGFRNSRNGDYELKNLQNSVSDTDSFAQQIKYEFEQYFLSADFPFSLAYQFTQGTEFQQKVWRSLLEIPLGAVITYGQLAVKLNSSPRAVGNACRHNPLALMIPCHRVVSASGLGGYAGDTLLIQKTNIDFLAIKKWLLKHEKADF